MNWDLILTVLVFMFMLAFFLPIYTAVFIAMHKAKFRATVEIMSEFDKKIKDHHFDEALKNMFEEGVEND